MFILCYAKKYQLEFYKKKILNNLTNLPTVMDIQVTRHKGEVYASIALPPSVKDLYRHEQNKYCCLT